MRLRGIVAGATLVVTWLTTGALLTETTSGVVSHLPATPRAFGRIAPSILPRTHPAPVTLSIGFESPAVEGSTPELESIDLELSRHITFETAGLPSCSTAQLYVTGVSADEICPRSRVGHGRVASEIRKPDGTTVSLTGHLIAFYSLEAHRRLILARVETGEPLPLVYVIPFTIARADGRFATDLSVSTQAMAGLQGICARNPYCFYSPHRLVGIYDRISSFEMSLHRAFLSNGGRVSFVSAVCPAPPGFREVNFPAMEVRLNYVSGPAPFNGVVTRNCRMARRTNLQG